MADPDDLLTLGQVFVPGGLPTVTYNPRERLRLEDHLRDYLDERHKILSLSGPTKSGKTVLLRSVVKGGGVWLSGGNIETLADFWSGVADQLGLFTSEEESDVIEDTAGRGKRGGIGIKGIRGELEGSDAFMSGRGTKRGRERPASLAAQDALRTGLHVVVVDDFHYIGPAVQLQIVRNLKELVFDGVPVIFASVPHRAYDAVRVEKEMTGRVEQLEIPFWSLEELQGIAHDGFRALNGVDEFGIAERLSAESFSSPHLMQDFCLQVCKESGLRSTSLDPVIIQEPEWQAFFESRASAASKSAFDLLARGPRQRTDRKQRTLTGGRVTDIYGVVLAAIADTGPLTKLTYEELRASLRKVMTSDPPQRHEVTRILEEMTRIARDQIEGEPVVDYDEELSTLFISDPFFAYFLRWGSKA